MHSNVCNRLSRTVIKRKYTEAKQGNNNKTNCTKNTPNLKVQTPKNRVNIIFPKLFVRESSTKILNIFVRDVRRSRSTMLSRN